MGDMRKIDKFRGCFIGGAAGDALGYAVEFMTENNITSKYGVDGISEYELVNGKALMANLMCSCNMRFIMRRYARMRSFSCP